MRGSKMKKYLTLDFASGWRTYAALVSFLASCGLEWAGVDVPGFTAPGVGEALMIALGALGIYERAKSPPSA